MNSKIDSIAFFKTLGEALGGLPADDPLKKADLSIPLSLSLELSGSMGIVEAAKVKSQFIDSLEEAMEELGVDKKYFEFTTRAGSSAQDETIEVKIRLPDNKKEVVAARNSIKSDDFIDRLHAKYNELLGQYESAQLSSANNYSGSSSRSSYGNSPSTIGSGSVAGPASRRGSTEQGVFFMDGDEEDTSPSVSPRTSELGTKGGASVAKASR